MNQKGYKSLQFNLSRIRFWLGLFAVVWLLSAIGLGWLVKSFLFLMGLLLLTPIIAFLGFRWWLKRNLVEDQCPVCGVTSAGLNGFEMRCPSCGEPLKVEKSHFIRLTPPGTVDIEAIEVPIKQIEDA